MRITKPLLVLAALALVAAGLPAASVAQVEDETAATVQTSSGRPGKDPGRFAKGNRRGAFFGGAGSTLGQTYLIVGGGLGYFVADGLEVGLDAEGWLLQSPTFWKVTPQVRYVLWQAGAVKPYVGAFWRYTFVGSGFDDTESYGGRVGVAYQRGGNYFAIGAVYERFPGDWRGDRDHWYPELAVWLSF